MDFRFTPEQERLRREVRQFLEEELPHHPRDFPEDGWMEGFSREFSRKMGARGWIGMTWPPEYGGQGRGPLDRLVVTEEMLRLGAPVAAHWIGDRQIGPSLIRYGSPAQKKEFLPAIIRGDISFCLGMSEPETGSDLASLQTRATAQGDDFVVSGQKIWTSGAHQTEYCYLVARTNPQAPKHKGISEFLVDMKLPGISLLPVLDMTGQHRFNQVFFDEVRVPRGCLIGEANQGWYQIAAQLDYERSGLERLMSNYPLFHDLLSLARELPHPQARPALADLAVEFEVGRLLCYRVAWLLTQGRVPNYEAAQAKAFCTEFQQRLAHWAVDLLGLFGLLQIGSPRTKLGGRAARAYLSCRAYTIQGGTSEILRNIVATRGLGLPSG